MKRVLITGATGFIGSHLARKLLSTRSYRIRVFIRPSSNCSRIRKLLPKVEVYTGDLCDPADIRKSLKDADILVHLASILKRGRPEDYKKYNINVSRNLFQEASRQRSRKVVYLSSMAVVKATRSPYLYTEADPLAPETLYGKSKTEVEKIAGELIRDRKADITILRPPAVYGEEDNFDRGFIRLIDLIARNRFIPFHDMRNFMSLIYIGNLIDAVLTCLRDKRSAGRTFFVADREILTTGDLYGLIARSTRARKKNWHVPTFLVKAVESFLESVSRIAGVLPGFPENFVNDLVRHYMCSSNRIQSELNWRPPFTLQQGMQRTIQWYNREHR